MYDAPWDDSEELADRLGEGLVGRIKSELHPMEYLVWADRPGLPPRSGSRSCLRSSFPSWRA